MDNLDIELRKHKFISFVEDHYNPLDVIRSLGEKGIKPIVILMGEHAVMIPHCKYVGKLHRAMTREDGYKILMDNYSHEEYKPFVFCSDDKSTSFLDQHYDEMKDHFIFYNAGEQGRVTWLQNKDNITNLGAQAGLDNPKKEVVDTGLLPKTLEYPIITKVLASTMGAWKNDVFICQNEDELREAYKKIKSPALLLQEYIRKKGEFDIEGFSINDGKDVFIPYIINHIRFYNNSYGHYMEVSPFVDFALKNKILALLRECRYNGIFELNFLKGPNDETYFLEVNFRASTWVYAVTVGGGNLPYNWAKSMISGRIHYEEMNLRTKPFEAIVEPSDFVRNAKKVGYLKWLKQCFSADCHYYFNAKDPMPFFSYVWHRVFGHRAVSDF